MDKKQKGKHDFKNELSLRFQELEDFINQNKELDPRSKAITNLQTSKMWAVKAIFEK
ncbi:hypothetical protein [Chryseobacterium sp. R2A-55]|uniref:hypothetical protein n=1 Tax=Chryseobacterium sp. R2A-55 TaxID=2744445 RepID=UPI001F297311|nr:hypothetical protein [Chryseobacterium sp. R2A-55]